MLNQFIKFLSDSSVKSVKEVGYRVFSSFIQKESVRLMLIPLFSFACLTTYAQYVPPYAVYKPVTSPRKNNKQQTKSSKIWDDYYRQQTSYQTQVVDGIYLKNGIFQVNRFKLKIYENGTIKVGQYLKNGKWWDAGNTPIRELISIPKDLEGMITHGASIYGFGDVYF